MNSFLTADHALSGRKGGKDPVRVADHGGSARRALVGRIRRKGQHVAEARLSRITARPWLLSAGEGLWTIGSAPSTKTWATILKQSAREVEVPGIRRRGFGKWRPALSSR